MKISEWYFSKRRPSGGRARNSQVGKFFQSDAVEDQTNAVIREGIQNSLDAGIQEGSRGAKSVNILISFGECPFNLAKSLFPKLFPHLDAVRDTLTDVPRENDAIQYLAFEDFNTTGLKGDPLQWDPPDNKNAFFNFFRGEGVTNKEGNQRGRHGVGKQVFLKASRANCVFGLTATAESSPLLMGTAVLPLHQCMGKSYEPDGWFGTTMKVDGDDFIGPIDDAKAVELFSNTFGLDRDNLPGLSIVVPWVRESITPASALLAVVKGFFWPVLQKRLYVDIRSSVGPNSHISGDNIGQIVEQLDPPDANLMANIKLATWAIGLAPEEIPTALPSAENAQQWDSSLLTGEVKEDLRHKLANDEPITLRIPMQVRRKRQRAEEAFFHVFIQPDTSGSDDRVQFIREGLLISGVKCRRCPGFRALVIVDEGPLASFLGDAENPSHTEWQAQNVLDKFVYARETLRYVVQSVPNLLKSLHDEQKTADPTLLLDLFSLPTPIEDSPKKKQPKKSAKNGGKTDPEKVIIKGTKPKRFSLNKQGDGFVIGKGAAEAETPQTLDIQVAYAVRRGSPLQKYRNSDFDLASKLMNLNAEGVTIESCEENRIRLRVDSPDFSVAVQGFGTNRDIYVDVKVDKNLPEKADAEDL